MSENIVIVGAGRMGLALGAALRQVHAAERLIFFGRAMEPPPHPLFDGEDAAEYRIGPQPIPSGTTILILAVPDAALAEVAYDLSRPGQGPPGCVALHLAGALSTEALAPLHAVGYPVGSLHPLQAIADPWHSGDRLIGAAYALAGEPAAINAARRLVNELEGIALVIPPHARPLYHASAVVASNYLIALLAFAVRLMMQTGVAESDAIEALIPLMKGTLDNLDHLGVAHALTGPIARGDADTVRLHLARLSATDRKLYCGLGLELLRVARAAGLDPDKANELEALLERSSA
ncbi:MAG TPA: Rossmann-like and DUF2520 domain-containing protein [Longimicrobiales bacterium]